MMSAEKMNQAGLHAHLLDCVTQAVVATDLHGLVIYWNRFAETLFGWTTEEALGRHVIDLTAAAEWSAQSSHVLETLMRGEKWSGEFHVRNRHGRAFIASVTNWPLLDDDGKLAGVIGVSSDVSEMRAVQDALQAREKQLADAQRLAHVGTVELNYRTGEELWTDEIYRIFEIDPSVAPNLDSLLERTHPDDREMIARGRRTARERGQPFDRILRIIVPSGEKSIKMTGQVLLAGGSPDRLLLAVQDITQQKRTETEIALRARQQAALAQVGQFALSNASIGFMFAQAGRIVREILEVDYCGIYKRTEARRLLLIGGAGWPERTLGTDEVDGGRESQAGYTLQLRQPVIVTDLCAEKRFTPWTRMLENHVTSAVTAPIESGDDEPWGVIGAHSRKRREFAPGDVDFLHALANTLGQAIERRRAEVELRVRALQQSAIAEIGQRVLTSDVDQSTFERACELVMSGLGVEFSTFLESDDDGQTLRFRAGQPWLVPPDPIPIESSHAGFAMKSGAAVNVPDYSEESRFEVNRLFTSYGIRSGLAVPVIGPARKFGVITAQTRTPKKFGPADVHFMESLATVFAHALTREAAKRDLIESEARFRSVVEGASEVIFSVSTEGEIISLNPAFEAITGWRSDEWIGRPFTGLLLPESVPEMMDIFSSIIREPRSVRLEVHVRGRLRPEIVLAAGVSPKIQRGEVIEIYGFARDVTEEKRFEAERNRVTREQQLILESTDEGIYATDIDGRCTLVNRSAAKLLGASPDWLIGRDMHALIHPRSPDSLPEQAEECAMLEVVRVAESRSSRDDIFCRADGSPFPVEYTASPIIDRGQVKGSVVTFNDISARRKLESKLEQANRLSSLGRLAATVAHEFNNVLMGISPFAEVVRRETLTDRAQMAADQILRSVKRGKRITEDILRFTQPSEPVLHDFDATAWLHSLALEARSLVGPRYTVDVHTPAAPVHVIGDAGQLHQSFINLILNARDSMADGGRIGISVDPVSSRPKFDFGTLQHPERYAHFIVEDSGHGMSPETLRHIFEPLFTTKKNGTGLGLPVTRHVVTRHGGELFVESAPGVGTKFHLFIPLADRGERAADTAADGGRGKPRAARARAYQRVLVVEDERPVASGIAALLELEGVDAKIVETGRDVLPAIADWKPDAIVLDIGLPDIDGTKVFASIAREYPLMPVVFSSGHGDESQLEEHLAQPNVAFLLKPYDIDTLLATLDRVVS